MTLQIEAIKIRLEKASNGPWIAAKGGSKILDSSLSNLDAPFYSLAEDYCILDFNQNEIIGSSEWMRVKWDNLDFMAHARQDIEYLLLEIDKLKAFS